MLSTGAIVMGLDGVEIVMRTEETFGIEIPNEVAARLLTPAALVDFVAANVSLKGTDECLSQQLFYRLRRGFRSQLKALSSTFDLDTPLKEILHKDQWPQVWAAVRAEVGQPEWPASIPWPGLLISGPKTVRELIWQVAASLPKPNSRRERPGRARVSKRKSDGSLANKSVPGITP
jgi:hypothetical protein